MRLEAINLKTCGKNSWDENSVIVNSETTVNIETSYRCEQLFFTHSKPHYFTQAFPPQFLHPGFKQFLVTLIYLLGAMTENKRLPLSFWSHKTKTWNQLQAFQRKTKQGRAVSFRDYILVAIFAVLSYRAWSNILSWIKEVWFPVI